MLQCMHACQREQALQAASFVLTEEPCALTSTIRGRICSSTSAVHRTPQTRSSGAQMTPGKASMQQTAAKCEARVLPSSTHTSVSEHRDCVDTVISACVHSVST